MSSVRFVIDLPEGDTCAFTRDQIKQLFESVAVAIGLDEAQKIMTRIRLDQDVKRLDDDGPRTTLAEVFAPAGSTTTAATTRSRPHECSCGERCRPGHCINVPC